jgi:hypothetical protein
MSTTILLEKLRSDVSIIIETIQTDFIPLPSDVLNRKQDALSWSILECIEHLNLYARFYLPEIEQAIKKCNALFIDEDLKYTWIGKYSVNTMEPLNLKKQKTFKHMNPTLSSVNKNAINEFLQHQRLLLSLLEKAAHVNINQGKVSVEFFRLLKMKIGEALQFVTVHQQRHILQARRVRDIQAPVLVL